MPTKDFNFFPETQPLSGDMNVAPKSATQQTYRLSVVPSIITYCAAQR